MGRVVEYGRLVHRHEAYDPVDGTLENYAKGQGSDGWNFYKGGKYIELEDLTVIKIRGLFSAK